MNVKVKIKINLIKNFINIKKKQKPKRNKLT